MISSKKKILIVGATGFIGQSLTYYLLKKGYNISGTTNNFDLLEKLPIPMLLLDLSKTEDINPDFFNGYDALINTSGVIGFKSCEENPNLAELINIKAIKKLTHNAKKSNSNLLWIQISTNAVFGIQKGPAKEMDTRNPISIYGKTKKDGENIVINSGLPYQIIRTTDVYGKYKYFTRRERFYDFVINSALEGKSVNFPKNILSNPIHINDFVNKIEQLIALNFEGVIHIAGKAALNRLEFAQTIAKLENVCFEHFSSDDLILTDNSLLPYNVLSIDKLTKMELSD